MNIVRAIERLADAADRTPTAMKLLTELERAVKHRDLGSRLYLVTQGWRDALEVANPDLRTAVEVSIPKFKDAWQTFQDTLAGRVIEGSFTEFDPPWLDFVRHYQALKWGVICLHGDPGQGKTEFMKKSAMIWQGKYPGQPIEGLGFYQRDRPDWIRPIAMKRLIARMTKVGQFVDQEETGIDYQDGLTDADFGKSKVARRHIDQSEIDQMGYRTVLVDEAGIFFSSFGGGGEQKTRDAAKRFSDQIRHLNSRFIFASQKISDIPPHVRGSAINIYKLAGKEVIKHDYKMGQGKRDNMERWFEALLALEAVITGAVPAEFPNWLSEDGREAIRLAGRAHVFYADEYADPRAWGYVVASRLGGHGIRTVFPFVPVESTSPPLLGPGVEILDADGVPV